MILTAEEYKRGFIDFEAIIPEQCSVELWVRTSDTLGEEGEWTGPYKDPSGSKIKALPKNWFQLSLRLNRGSDPTQTPVVKKIRIDRNGDSYIWPGSQGFTGNPKILRLGRDYGCSYRLIFRPQKAIWPESFVLIKNNTRIRFWNEGIKGYEIINFTDKKLSSDGHEYLEGGVKETLFQGNVIEILTTVPMADEVEGIKEAKTKVESIMGLLAICCGEEILGTTLSEEYHFSDSKGEQGAIPIKVSPKADLSIDINASNLLDKVISNLYSEEVNPSIHLSLRWYAKGLLSTSPSDAFIAYFIGLDALASGYFANVSPMPLRKEYDQLERYLEETKPPIDDKLKQKLFERIKDYPLPQKFEVYCEKCLGEASDKMNDFINLNRIRGELFHGKAKIISQSEVDKTRTLLETLLGHELQIDELITKRQAGPKVLEMTLRYVLGYGQGRIPSQNPD